MFQGVSRCFSKSNYFSNYCWKMEIDTYKIAKQAEALCWSSLENNLNQIFVVDEDSRFVYSLFIDDLAERAIHDFESEGMDYLILDDGGRKDSARWWFCQLVRVGQPGSSKLGRSVEGYYESKVRLPLISGFVYSTVTRKLRQKDVKLIRDRSRYWNSVWKTHNLSKVIKLGIKRESDVRANIQEPWKRPDGFYDY